MKKYSKAQIEESIKYWEKQLDKLNENRVREGNLIYSDTAPVGEDAIVELGKEASITTINDLKKDKVYPIEHVEKCTNLQDLHDIQKKYKHQYLVLQWADLNGDGQETLCVIPANTDDFKFLSDEFGPGSNW